MQRQSPAHATVIATGLFIGGLLGGALAGRAAVARVQDPYAQLDLFARVLTTIEEDYVEEIPPEDLIDAAITGMVDHLDRQSRWLAPDQLQDLRDDAEGATTGIGIELEWLAEGGHVVRVLEGSPAKRDGISAGDMILEVDGRPLAGLDLDELRGHLSGERGQSTILTVMRDGWAEPREIKTVRDRVERDVVSGTMFDGVAYVRLAQFQEGSAADVEAEILHQASDVGGIDGLSGVVLDLRDNPGGLLTEAVAVTDLFLDEGVIVSTQGRKSDDEVHRATPGGFPASLDVVVLINGMSASASEIVAGALQDTSRGQLVGTHSYGKGTVQQVYLHSAPGEAALKLTVGRYYTPSGEPVAPKEGRKPDHEVALAPPASPDDQLRARLSALDLPDQERAHLLALLDSLPEARPVRLQIDWDSSIEDRIRDDPQLQRAVELLK